MLRQKLFVFLDHLGTIGLHAADANPLVFLMEEHVVGRGVEGFPKDLDLTPCALGGGEAHVVRRPEFIESMEDRAGRPTGLRVEGRGPGQQDKKCG